MQVTPADHFINWQQDPFANYLGRLVFPEKTDRFIVEVDLVAEMIIINPFDFFLEPQADFFPFAYDDDLKTDLAPYRVREGAGEKLTAYVADIDRTAKPTIDFLVGLNQQLNQDISYLIRLEPNVQSCEQTLTLGSGSCPRLGLVDGQYFATTRSGRPVCIRLSDPAGPGCQIPGRSIGTGRRFYGSARLDRGVPAWSRLGGDGPHLRPFCR